MSATEPRVAMAMLRSAVWIDARRPASWLAIVAAIAGGFGLVAGGLPAATGLGPLALASGGLLAVAAIGHVPRGVHAGRRPWLALVVARGGWSVAGFFIAAIVAAVFRQPGPVVLAGIAAASAAATSFLHAALLRTAETGSLAASQSLVIAGGAAAASLACELGGGGLFIQVIAAVAVWGLLAAAAVFDRTGDLPDWLGQTATATRRRRAETASAAAMATTLAAMVGCYFLSPQFAWVYAVVATGWFVCLAVPPATEMVGPPATVRLVRGAAGHPKSPGSVGRAGRLAGMLCALLGWPAVVAAVLPAADGVRAGGPPLALAWLLAVAIGLVAAVAVAASAPKMGGDTARAVVLSAVAAAALAAAHVPQMPQAPASLQPVAGSLCTSGVEPSQGSCKTS